MAGGYEVEEYELGFPVAFQIEVGMEQLLSRVRL